MSVEVEIKTCEACGRLFVRVIEPQPCRDCPDCQLHPPPEREVAIVVRSYRVVGVKIEL